MRWMILFLVALVVLISFMPFLRRWGLGRLPGDIYFKIGRFEIEIPLMSTLIVASIFLIVGKLL